MSSQPMTVQQVGYPDFWPTVGTSVPYVSIRTGDS